MIKFLDKLLSPKKEEKVINSEAIDARELFFDPKQGEKVLWKGGAMLEFREGIFVTEYNGFFLIEYDGQIHYGKEIKHLL